MVTVMSSVEHPTADAMMDTKEIAVNSWWRVSSLEVRTTFPSAVIRTTFKFHLSPRFRIQFLFY